MSIIIIIINNEQSDRKKPFQMIPKVEFKLCDVANQCLEQ